jgi:dsDNA-specific endonuclease/ATPase MutS2
MVLSSQQKMWLEMNSDFVVSFDLHYHHLDDLENLVEKFLNDNFLDRHQNLSFIHGHGTGALRAKLHQILENHPLVKETWMGNNGGVTYVILDLY